MQPSLKSYLFRVGFGTTIAAIESRQVEADIKARQLVPFEVVHELRAQPPPQRPSRLKGPAYKVYQNLFGHKPHWHEPQPLEVEFGLPAEAPPHPGFISGTFRSQDRIEIREAERKGSAGFDNRRKSVKSKQPVSSKPKETKSTTAKVVEIVLGSRTDTERQEDERNREALNARLAQAFKSSGKGKKRPNKNGSVIVLYAKEGIKIPDPRGGKSVDPSSVAVVPFKGDLHRTTRVVRKYLRPGERKPRVLCQEMYTGYEALAAQAEEKEKEFGLDCGPLRRPKWMSDWEWASKEQSSSIFQVLDNSGTWKSQWGRGNPDLIGKWEWAPSAKAEVRVVRKPHRTQATSLVPRRTVPVKLEKPEVAYSSDDWDIEAVLEGRTFAQSRSVGKLCPELANLKR